MLSNHWLIPLAAIALVSMWQVWRKLSGPSYIALGTRGKVREVLRTALRHGARGARVRFQVHANPRVHCDFAKYFAESGGVGLRAVMDQPPFNSAALLAIEGVLERLGIAYALSRGSKRRVTMEIDVGSDLVLAERVAYAVFEDALGLNLARDVVAIYDLVLITNDPTLTGVVDP